MTAGTWDHHRYCDATEAQLAALLDAADAAGPDEPVPGCPGWTVGDLLRHLGYVHRWAGGMVEAASPDVVPMRDLAGTAPKDPAELRPWFVDGAAALLATLRATDPETVMWAWGSGGRAGFWARRMLHENTVHRCDADVAAGREPAVDAGIAADGIEELLALLPVAPMIAPKTANLRGKGEVLALAAPDAGARWLVRLQPDGFTWTREDAAADPGGPDVSDAQAAVRGNVSDLFLFLWGRRKLGDPRLEFSGDDALLVHWVENSAL